MSPHLYSANSTSTMSDQLQQFQFAVQSNFQKAESASYCTMKCDPEIRRLQAQLQECLVNQETLEVDLRWALEAKHVAEVALAEHVSHTRSIIDNLVASPPPRGPLDWLNDNGARDVDTESDLSLFSQPLITSSRGPKMVDHRHENGKHCDEVTKELEMQLAKLSTQFQLLAECHSATALRLEQTQRDVYKLKSENLDLQSSSTELVRRCQLKDRRLQQLLMEKSEVSSLPSVIYGIGSSPGDPAHSRVSSPEVIPSNRMHNTDGFDDCSGGGPVSCGANVAGVSTLDYQGPMASLSQLCISADPIAAQGEKLSLPPAAVQRGVGKSGRNLSERANISALVIPKPDLRSWCLPHKHNSRELQQPESPGTASPIMSKASSVSASATGTPVKCASEDLTQSTDCTLLLDANPVILKTAAANDLGSVSKVATAVNGQVTPMLHKSISIRASGTSVMTVRANVSCQTKKKRSVSPESTESIQSLVLSPVSPLAMGPHRLRLSPTMDKEELPSSGSGKEGADQDEDVEWDVEWSGIYDQGMYKTELCNKWQEGGSCPYANRCRFAHGVEELRPVLRHPRYKTELCRMVANGERCPYGHRCHFRHAMTKEERASLLQIQSSV